MVVIVVVLVLVPVLVVPVLLVPPPHYGYFTRLLGRRVSSNPGFEFAVVPERYASLIILSKIILAKITVARIIIVKLSQSTNYFHR